MKIIHQEITIKAPVEKMWRHLTDPQKILTHTGWEKLQPEEVAVLTGSNRDGATS